MSEVDLILFAGQSNMAGRGAACALFPEKAPAVLPGAGWEYRAVSAPGKLFPIQEPFGVNENNPSGIHETLKTGSLVSAFVNAYYAVRHVPVVAVSASKGGSVMREWAPGTAYLNDAMARLDAAKAFLIRQGIPIRRTFVVWCQGESDGDAGTEKEAYLSDFDGMLREMNRHGVESLLMIQIGNCNLSGAEDRYLPMISWQEELARTRERVVMVSRKFAGMRDRGLMKDAFHYYQAGYNDTGEDAGRNAAAFANVYETNVHKEE